MTSENITEDSQQQQASSPILKKKLKKRTFTLHEFENGPKGGGKYCGTPAQAAKKAANRWVCGKEEFETPKKFFLRETTQNSEKKIFEFLARRIKLKTPKIYKRGGKEISVNSKVELL